MKKQLATIFIVLLMVVTSIFGLVLLDHEGNHDKYCAVAQMQNIKCPENSLAMAEVHIAAIRDFSNAFIPLNIILILSLVLLLGVAYRLRRALFLWRVRPRYHFNTLENYTNRFSQAILSWLSLFELSPSFALAATR